MKTHTTYARKITMTALLSAISTLLMLIEFSIPIMPSFLKLDFSDVPALIASFSMGPLSGVMVVFIKNLLSIFSSSTLGVGQLCNFIVGSAFVFTSGFIYSKNKTRKAALIAMLSGTLVMSVIAVFVNYYLIMPLYSLIIPMDSIINMCKAINPNVNSLFKAVIIFILPFNIIKGLIVCCITFILYKKLSPVIKGYHV